MTNTGIKLMLHSIVVILLLIIAGVMGIYASYDCPIIVESKFFLTHAFVIYILSIFVLVYIFIILSKADKEKEFNCLTIYGEIASIDTQIRELNNKKDILLKKLKYETESPIRRLNINEFNKYEQRISYIDSFEGWCLNFDGTIPARYVTDCSNRRYKKLENSNSLFRVMRDGANRKL